PARPARWGGGELVGDGPAPDLVRGQGRQPRRPNRRAARGRRPEPQRRRAGAPAESPGGSRSTTCAPGSTRCWPDLEWCAPAAGGERWLPGRSGRDGAARRSSCRREPRRMAADLDLAAGCSEVMVRRLLRGTGWTFIGMGSFVLYLLVYQLVGTNAVTSRGQDDLRNELQREWAAPAASRRPPNEPHKVEET